MNLPRGSSRALRFLLLAGAVAIFVYLSRGWPRDRTMHYVLGDAAPRVRELSVHYGEGSSGSTDGDFTRGATFHFEPGTAPRIVTHEVRLAEGDYTVQIEVASRTDRVSFRRRVRIDQDTMQIDVSKQVPE